MAHLEEKTISSEQKFDGRIVKLYVDKAELEDGKIVTREVIRHPGGVCVLPLTDKNEVMFVKQFRYPHQTVLLEIPAGKLEYGENHSECGLRSTQRNLKPSTFRRALCLTARICRSPAIICLLGKRTEFRSALTIFTVKPGCGLNSAAARTS